MLTASQLDVLFELSRPITEAEAIAFNAIAETLTPERADNDTPDVESFRPWLAALGIRGPEPRIGILTRRLAGAARRIAARG